MEDIVRLIIYPASLAFVVSLFVTPIVIKLAPKLGIMDNPARRKHPATLHKKPIPRGGGIPVLASIIVGSIIFLPIPPDQRLAGILLGAAVLVLIGLWDDRTDVNPYMRLVGQFFAAGIVVASGIGIAFISNPLGGGIIDLSQPRMAFSLLGEEREIWVLSVIFGLLWIVGMMNAVSWASGVDGQLSGTASIAAFVIAILSLRFSADITQWPVTILAGVVAGAFLGFLPYHAYPQKIMPGFGGATLAGFMLAVLSLLATAKVGTLLLVLAIPVVDAGYAITRRILAGKSPVWGDRGHLHHRLMNAGWSKQKIAVFYWVATGILGVLALYLNAKEKFYTIVGIALVIGALFLWLPFSSQSQKPQGRVNG